MNLLGFRFTELSLHVQPNFTSIRSLFARINRYAQIQFRSYFRHIRPITVVHSWWKSRQIVYRVYDSISREKPIEFHKIQLQN